MLARRVFLMATLFALLGGMRATAPALARDVPNPIDSGGGDKKVEHVDALTDEQRKAIEADLAASIALLLADGKIPPSIAAPVLLSWPLKQINGLRIFDHHGISNFVDLNPNDGALLDYNCGVRTYDLPGYDHSGIDYFMWPFGWLWMDNAQAAIVAAAPGVIIQKSDGNPDRSCTFGGGSWNAVYVRHDDNTVVWYGHMKRLSLTGKGVGERVERGEYLGIVGSSGNSSGPHLHFEVHSAVNQVIEPHAGACNGLASSLWENQRPYYDSRVNMMMTGYAPPGFPSCPQQEVPNARLDFLPNSTIYFTTTYHDQLSGQVSLYRIFQPDGTLWTSWTHGISDAHYAASWWWRAYNFAGAPTGIWRFEVTFSSQIYTHYFSIGGPFTVGRLVGDGTIGSPLSATRLPGGELSLSWGATCMESETDWAIYEGDLGQFYSHQPKLCSTGGQASAVITPSSADAYYVVVARNAGWEGSHGTNSLGVERPPPDQACRLQNLGGCCGDGERGGAELCDGADLGAETCQTQGIGLGMLACLSTCDGFVTAGCVPCGDNVRTDPESCDGVDLGGQSCLSQGFDGGGLSCIVTCDGFDTSGCTSVCGDGVLRGNEMCDGADLGGESCLSQGFDSGTLACNGACDGFMTAACTTICGDGVRRGIELCDGTDLGGQSCLDHGFYGGSLACNGACNGFITLACTLCGNNMIDGAEVCDGSDLAGETCVSQGFDGGTLGCGPTCADFNISGCRF